ncbi:UNVERIFIED_CONTAM: hypothetical protein GTU68_022920 [Idotea baltica]|nr:hypothetical protein [Idotea baltica]
MYCGRVFKLSGDLNRHLRTHTGEKPYQCPECFKKFTRASTLRCHLRIHTGEKPFPCSRCSYHAVRREHLIQHMWRVHRETLPKRHWRHRTGSF